MMGSHTVDLLSSGLVVKTANSEMFNGKLRAEVDLIRALHDIYPELIVPILHDGMAAGRQFYILEKKDALPLSEIVFDNQRSLVERRMIVHHALGSIQKAIDIEMNGQSTLANDMPARLQDEWESISFVHELFDKPILLNGVQFGMTARDVFEKALVLASTEKFNAVEKAHFNFHFGNVLYNEDLSQVSFIDPDFSVRGIDPHFGFSRFAFSFWHELATESEDAVEMVPMSGALMFVLRKSDYGNILSEIPEISGISGLLPWVDESIQKKFYVLTTYCFLRSIRINGSKEPWKKPRLPVAARPEEVLMLGLLSYLEGPGIELDSSRA